MFSVSMQYFFVDCGISETVCSAWYLIGFPSLRGVDLLSNYSRFSPNRALFSSITCEILRIGAHRMAIFLTKI